MRVELRETIDFVPANRRAKTNHHRKAITIPDNDLFYCVNFVEASGI